MSSSEQSFKTSAGNPPTVGWTHESNVPLTAFAYARESGQVFCTDKSGHLWRFSPAGEVDAVQKLSEAPRAIAWSDDGTRGVGLFGENHLSWINSSLAVRETLQLPDTTVALAIDPYGEYIAVSTSSGSILVFDGPRQPVLHIDTLRPLTKLQFLTLKPELIGISDSGLIARFDMRGKQVWQINTFGSIGDCAADGKGESLFVASYALGLQKFDEAGENEGTYQLSGTVVKVACSHEATRLAVATQEGKLIWLSEMGEVLWTGRGAAPITWLACEPFATGLFCAQGSTTLCRLDWPQGA
ncbi:MAG: WD40 repeat domain-containing protein [Planctomycetales bacterium]